MRGIIISTEDLPPRVSVVTPVDAEPELVERLAAAALGIGTDELRREWTLIKARAASTVRERVLHRYTKERPRYRITAGADQRLIAEITQNESGRWVVARPDGTLYGLTYQLVSNAFVAAAELVES